MANTIQNPTLIAKAAVRILDNELGMSSRVFRAEDEFSQNVNGYKPGASVSFRKPAQFTVRSGATASTQDVVEGATSLSVNQQIGVDFKLSSLEETLNIGGLSERVLKPAMVQIANKIDRDVAGLYNQVWNWAYTNAPTTAVTSVDSFAKFLKGVQRLNEGAVPFDMRSGILSPADEIALAGAQAGMYVEKLASDAYRDGAVGKIAQVSTYMSQNAPIHTTGTRAASGEFTVSGGSQNVAYTSVLTTGSVPGTQSLTVAVTGTKTMKAGDVFTIANVYAVNPVTKQTLTYLQQFVVTADASITTSGNITIAPAIITSGAFQTVDSVPANSAAISFVGSASSNLQQNMMFHKNAFALAVVPMEKPKGATYLAQESYKGLTVRLIAYYDGVSDVDQFRFDALYGVKCLDPRLATRLNG